MKIRLIHSARRRKRSGHKRLVRVQLNLTAQEIAIARKAALNRRMPVRAYLAQVLTLIAERGMAEEGLAQRAQEPSV